MIATAKIYLNGSWQSVSLYNVINLSDRFDETLDGATIQLRNNTLTAYPQGMPVELFIQSGEHKIGGQYISFDRVEQRALGYCVHGLTLVEPSRLLMGETTDGLRITQPITGAKKSLFDTVQRILTHYKANETEWIATQHQNPVPHLVAFASGNAYNLLRNTESPEFEWGCGTLLWEMLCDVGAVVNLIPRLKMGSSKFNVVDFDDINADYGEFEI